MKSELPSLIDMPRNAGAIVLQYLFYKSILPSLVDIPGNKGAIVLQYLFYKNARTACVLKRNTVYICIKHVRKLLCQIVYHITYSSFRSEEVFHTSERVNSQGQVRLLIVILKLFKR